MSIMYTIYTPKNKNGFCWASFVTLECKEPFEPDAGNGIIIKYVTEANCLEEERRATKKQGKTWGSFSLKKSNMTAKIRRTTFSTIPDFYE